MPELISYERGLYENVETVYMNAESGDIQAVFTLLCKVTYSVSF